MTSSKVAKSPNLKTKPAPQSSKSRSSRVPAPDHPSQGTSHPGSPADTAAPTPHPDVLKKPELLQRVSETTGLPKSRIRPVMEAMLTILGEAVAEERALQLPPLGKVKPLRSKAQGTGRVSHVKIRQVPQKTTAVED
ncbi:MAG: HU family DNA-binding protein [Pseudomonadota bacterium]